MSSALLPLSFSLFLSLLIVAFGDAYARVLPRRAGRGEDTEVASRRKNRDDGKRQDNGDGDVNVNVVARRYMEDGGPIVS